MAPPKKPAAQAEIALLQSLKSCLVNLPSSLVSVLTNANTVAQNVVIELSYRQPLPRTPDSTEKTPGSIPKSIFVGWTGMQSKRKLAGVVGRDGIAGSRGNSQGLRDQDVQVVELDATFARLLGISDGMKVGVSLHVDPPQAHTINIEPLTPADWEMIELHAQFLELNFLSQVRAIPNPAYVSSSEADKQPSHPLTLHLSPTSTANIKATNITPSPPSNSPFVKISPDAEIIVAPKTRRSEKTSGRESRSVGGRSGKSGRSGASTVRHRSSRELSRGVVFLRGVDRSLGGEWFDEDEEDIKDEGLRVWVDREVLLTKALRGVTWVSVTVVKPAGLVEPIDPQKDAAEPEKPTTRVVARIGAWEDAPDSQHVALSSMLSKVLVSEGMVGGLVRIEAAPTQATKSSKPEDNKLKEVPAKGIKILPFSASSSQAKSGFKFGGESKQEREESLQKLKVLLGKEGNGLLHGPLTDGMLLPAITKGEHAWPGGILRFDPPPPISDKKPQPRWFSSAERTQPMEVVQEVPKPSSSLKSWSPGEALSSTLPSMVGIDSVIEQLTSHLSHSSSVLLTGGLGSGKSSLAQLIAHRLRENLLFHTIYFSCRTLVTDETRVSAIKETLNRLFGAAAWGARLGGRSVVILDDLDKLCPVETELEVGGDNARSRHISECLGAIARQYCAMDSGVVLLATAGGKEALNNSIIGGHVVREIVNLSAPNKDGRRRVLESLAHAGSDPARPLIENDSTGSRPSTSDGPSSGFKVSPTIDFLDIAGSTDGYMPGDLVFLTTRARSECLIRTISSTPTSNSQPTPANTPLTLTSKDYAAALKGFTPASLRNVTLQTSTVQWSSIGGLNSTRQTLLETLQYPTTYAPIFSRCPLRLRSGLLLYGYPGCGKTLLASAIASQTGLNFISVKGPEILNKYIGASEKSVRDLFERAQAARPCVLFFDEFDSIAPKRGHDSTGVTDRVVNQLLTQMDGAEGLSGVYVLAATSRPDLIDPALLRPGRLDKSLECGMPSLGDRIEILQAVSSNVRIGSEVEGRWEEVAQRTEGYSGADLQALVYNAQLEAVHDVLGDGDLDPSKFGKAGGKDKGSKGLPEFSHFKFGDTNLEFEEEVGSKALAERVIIANKIRDLQAHRRRQKLLLNPTPAPQPQTHHQFDSGDDSLPTSLVTSPQKKVGNGKANGVAGEGASKEPIILWKHIQSSLSSTRASISAQERKRLAKIYGEFVDARSGDLPSGQGGTEVGARSSLM
ncbi:AAA-domain-containing protein [Tothia fuscella]|uniref:Peroxisomal ATPase PEX1 n=1 Tax=Tothia fuscella TaxID=1048955 RepID=A0A9P4P190_9PEZI|nr:AAA-domain-containing protein [Tothia fuscella]